MPPKSFVEQGVLRSYDLNDIVLARTHRNPYWPAYIRKCEVPDDPRRGDWRISWSNTGNGLLWCVFINNDHSCWVSTENIKAFSLVHADYTLCRCRTNKTKRLLAVAIEKARIELQIPGMTPKVLAETNNKSIASNNEIQNVDGSSSDDDGDVVMAHDSQEKSAGNQSNVVKLFENETPIWRDTPDGKGPLIHRHIPIPGDLVLAKTGTYPFWPGIVSRCVSDNEKWNNRWMLPSTSDTTQVRVWCAFLNDSTGGWVPLNRVRPYVPDVANNLLCRPKSPLYDDHCKALKEADEIYNNKVRFKKCRSEGKSAPRKQGGQSMEPKELQSVSGSNDGFPGGNSADVDISNCTNAEYLLDDIVLAKYNSSSPYWPALIRICEKLGEYPGRLGQWRMPVDGATPELVCCYFLTDGTEAWVTAKGIKKFDPSLAQYFICTRSTTLFEVQRRAIKEASLMLEKPIGTRAQSIPSEVVEWKEGDIVLASFHECPFWPARIQKSTESNDEHYGQWKQDKNNTLDTMYYCSFLLHVTAKWTVESEIRMFTPAQARSYSCDKQSRLYKIQCEAINLASKLNDSNSLGDGQILAAGTETEARTGGAPSAKDSDVVMQIQSASASAPEGPIVFALNDLGLAKYNPSGAFWPVWITSDPTDPEQMWKREGLDGKAEEYFCDYINHKFKRWMPVDQMKLFTPHRARRFLVGRTSPVFQKNRGAVKEASRIFKERKMASRGEQSGHEVGTEVTRNEQAEDQVAADQNDGEQPEPSVSKDDEAKEEREDTEESKAETEEKHTGMNRTPKVCLVNLVPEERETKEVKSIASEAESIEKAKDETLRKETTENKGDKKRQEKKESIEKEEDEEEEEEESSEDIKASHEREKQVADEKMAIAKAEAKRTGKRQRIEVIEASGTVKRKKDKK